MHQYLFFIGNFPIRLYGIFFSLGIISGCITAYFLLKKDRRGWESHMFDLGLVIAFAGIVGGRLWDVFFFDRDGYPRRHYFCVYCRIFLFKETSDPSSSFCRYCHTGNYFRTGYRTYRQFYEWRRFWTSHWTRFRAALS